MSYEDNYLQSDRVTLREELKRLKEANERLTTRVKRQQHLLDHYRQAVENSPNAIFSINRLGNITTWNPACTELFDARDAILGSHFGRLLSDPAQVEFIEQAVLQ